jgi:oxygen-independent coproporphyrinogen-3 oxidase
VDVGRRFAEPLRDLEKRGLVTIDADSLRLSREGLLQVDKLLHEFFLPQHRSARYA